MRWLPPIVVGASELYWPLADSSSPAVETALLSDGVKRQGLLAAMLPSDPALCAWAVVRAALENNPELDSCDAVAEWLAPRIAGYFFAAFDEQASTDPPSDSARQHFARRAAATIVTAELAADYAAAEGTSSARTRLAALLDSASQLVEVRAITAHGRTPSLREAIGPESDVRLHATGSISECVCRARAALSRAEAELPPGWDGAAIERKMAAAHATWQIEDTAARERLPLLVSRLRRLDELESKFQTILEREKLESLRQLAYGAGHEINNPLANISARAQTLIKEERDPERRRRLAAINSQAYRAHEMIADLMLFSRPPQLRPERLELTPLVDRVIRELLPEAQQRGASIARRHSDGTEPTPRALADGVQLAVALRAMCVNSLEALGSGGCIVLEVRPRREVDGREWIELVVTDDGPGIKPDVRRHLFDPFYSGREAGRGLGFGLSKCWRIVTDHGGEIEVDSPPGRGAVFTIRLPAA